MNTKRRKKLAKAIDLLKQSQDIVYDCLSEEESALDNLPEGLQESDKGCQISENCETLEEIADCIDEIISQMEDI